VGRGAQWQCSVATDRANTPATSRQFERGMQYTARYMPVPVKSWGAHYT